MMSDTPTTAELITAVQPVSSCTVEETCRHASDAAREPVPHHRLSLETLWRAVGVIRGGARLCTPGEGPNDSPSGGDIGTLRRRSCRGAARGEQPCSSPDTPARSEPGTREDGIAAVSLNEGGQP
jgi:hypothetical protein